MHLAEYEHLISQNVLNVLKFVHILIIQLPPFSERCEERHLKECDLQITIGPNDVGVFVALADLHNSIHESGAKTPPMQLNAAASFGANPSLFTSQMKRVAATRSSISI